MIANKQLLIIMPARNEAQNLPGVLDRIEREGILEFADLLVINDASQDDTPRIIAERGYKMVTNVFCLGYGGAIQVGYKYAVQKGYRYLIQMDADGQHDLCNIRPLYEAILHKNPQGLQPDLVLGTRYWEGALPYRLSFAKRLAHKLFRLIIRAATGQAVSDPTSGLQAMNRRTFSFCAQYDNFDARYPDANMLIQLLLLGFRVEEIAAVMHPRVTGKSIHSGLKPAWYMVRMLFSSLAVIVRIKLLKLDAGGQG